MALRLSTIPSTEPSILTDRRSGRARPASCAFAGDRLEIAGEIDQASVRTVRAALIDALHDPSVRAVDLSHVTFFGAAAIGLLEEFAMHHRYEVIGTPHIDRILGVVGCRHLLTRISPMIGDHIRPPGLALIG